MSTASSPTTSIDSSSKSAPATSHAAPLLVLGTRNRKKRLELEELLAPLGIRLATLDDFPQAIEVDETGTTFAENARLKASEQALALRQWVLGEDSGLSVDALQGAPGVYSARYAGAHGDDEANNRRLLAELGDLPLERRTAWYTCTMALADPQGVVRAESAGICRGRIRFEASGANGFGYDPLFEIPEFHQTFGELGAAVKAVLSHRARAIRQFVPLLAAQLVK